MAIIQQIRNRFGIWVAIFIGVALIAFILGMFITEGGFMNFGGRNTIAKINGSKVKYEEFRDKAALSENALKLRMTYDFNVPQDMDPRTAQYDSTWVDLLNEYLYKEQFEDLGLAISFDEYEALTRGTNPHRVLLNSRIFRDQNNQFSIMQVDNILNNIRSETPDPQLKLLWFDMENDILYDRLKQKYLTLIQKGLYVNKLEIAYQKKAMATSANISYIQKKYTEIPDSKVSVSKSEIKKYYKEHKGNFKQEESRDIKYVAFEVIPSSDDTIVSRDYTYTPEFINEFAVDTVEIFDYLEQTMLDWTLANYKRGELPSFLDEFMFANGTDTVYGPYLEGDYWKVAKLTKKHNIADSVKLSQIVLAYNQYDFQQVQAEADSLMELAKEGFNFDDLVAQNSDDPNAKINGGEIGWIAEADKFGGFAFSDSCFNSKPGHVILFPTQGAFYLIKITDMTKRIEKAEVAVLSTKIEPGSATDNKVYQRASEWARKHSSLESFNAAVSDNKPRAISVNGLKPMEKGLPGIPESRDIVRWAYGEDIEVGSSRDEVYLYDRKYIVPIVTGVNDKEYKTWKEAKSTIERKLIKDKKGELLSSSLKAAMSKASSIDDIANTLDLPVNSATNIRFGSAIIPNLGAEHKLIAAAIEADEETAIHGPISGQNGVYLFSVENKTTAPEDQIPADEYIRQQIQNYYNRLSGSIFEETLLKLSDVEDYRYKIY